MMRSKIEFFRVPFYQSPGYDEDLMRRKRPFKRDLGVLLRSLGVLRGYGLWVSIRIIINMAMSTLIVMVPFLNKVIIDDVLPTKDWDLFWTVIGIWIVVEFLQGPVVRMVDRSLDVWTNNRMGLWLQVQFYRHLQKLSPALIERKGVGDLMYRIHGDTMGVIGMVGSFYGTIVGRLWEFALFLVFMSVLDPWLLIIVFVYEAFYLVSTQIFGTWLQKVEFYVKEAKGRADARMQEGLHGVETVKTFARLKHETASFVHRVAVQLRVEVMAQALDVVKRTLLRFRGFFPYFKEILITWTLYWKVIDGEMTYGSVLAVISFLKIMERPVEKLIEMWLSIRFRMVQCERVYQVWDAPVEIVNKPDARPVPDLKGTIDIQNIDFEYDNAVQVLFDVSLRVEPGEFVAIVGPSGSGKSTVMNLLLRLYDPNSGRILVDGVDLRDFDHTDYRRRLGVVLQETFLSKESLRWNLLLGNYEASDEEMVAALERCRLRPWLEKLPDGLDSDLSEGTRVSIGEKQRLGVARALLRRSNILLLDEPTSSLDLDTEKEVMNVIHDVRRGKTTIQVTHRLNTIVGADKIFVMKEGRVVEVGTHRELIAKGGEYHHLVNLYSKG